MEKKRKKKPKKKSFTFWWPVTVGKKTLVPIE